MSDGEGDAEELDFVGFFSDFTVAMREIENNGNKGWM